MGKRLIICSDGTWNHPDSGYPTNVIKTARAIRTRSPDGSDQVVFYHRGVGAGPGSDRLAGGAFGNGIDRNIQDAYRFLVHNYTPGDAIFLLGFSRGAFTVRSLAGLIRNCGLLKKARGGLIPEAYALYRSRHHPDSSRARRFRALHARPVRIRFMGVWDTVGALGIPLGLFKRFNVEKYCFHDTRISSIILKAYHAVAIDEKRKSFAPTLWKTRQRRRGTAQVWFAGVHSDVGGGYRETGLADIAWKWMLARAKENGLSVDRKYIKTTMSGTTRRILHRSLTGAFRVLGREDRIIGEKNPADEYVHRSAVLRLEAVRSYSPRNLRTYLEETIPAKITS
ncbi:MAG: DUF2235 domain-containing protein [Acidobacteriota bacterium]